jgi:hypothetical protein
MFLARTVKVAILSSVALFMSVPAHANLIITPTFDASITDDSNSAAIIGVINSAIGFYQSNFSDPINVAITFQSSNSGLGGSSFSVYKISYQNFINALIADGKTADDATALGLLPSTATNPVNGSSTINIKPANARAIGLACCPNGGSDGAITLNTHITDVGSAGTSGQYSLLAVTMHEINEILGLGSDLPGGGTGGFFNDPLPEDLYRYDSTGARNYTTAGDNAYFSINGTTDLARFNQVADGTDYGDWWWNGSHTPQVQDGRATPLTSPTLNKTSPETRALDVIGYDLITAPEPGTVVLLVAGLGILGFMKRRVGVRS